VKLRATGDRSGRRGSKSLSRRRSRTGPVERRAFRSVVRGPADLREIETEAPRGPGRDHPTVGGSARRERL